MAQDEADTARRETAGMGRPLFFSAAAHLLALSAALQFGVVSAAVPFRGVVQILLVEDPEGPSGRPAPSRTGIGSEGSLAPRPPVPGFPAAPAVVRAASPMSGSAPAASPPPGVAEAPAPPEPSASSPDLHHDGPTPQAGKPRHQAPEPVPYMAMKTTAAAGKGPEVEGVAARPGFPAISGDAAPLPAGLGAETSARAGRPAPPGMPAGSGAPGGTAGSASVGAPRSFRPDGAPSAAVAGPPGTGAGTGPGTAWGGDAARLRARIQSRIVYPEEAVRRGQQGEVLLRIRVGSGGLPGEIVVARSSGVRVLDEAARRGVARAAPLPSEPGWVEVPVHFRLH